MEVELCLFLKQRSHWWMLPAWLLSQHIHLSLWLIRHREERLIGRKPHWTSLPCSCSQTPPLPAGVHVCVCPRFQQRVCESKSKKNIFFESCMFIGDTFPSQTKVIHSSAAQMSGVNDNCYVHYYIQQQNTSIPMEPFLSTSAGGETMVVGPMTAHSGWV